MQRPTDVEVARLVALNNRLLGHDPDAAQVKEPLSPLDAYRAEQRDRARKIFGRTS